MEIKKGLSLEDFQKVNNINELVALIEEKSENSNKVKKIILYDEELRLLQIELVKLQRWISKNNKRVAIIFEGRDAAGKGAKRKTKINYLWSFFI